MVTRTRCPSSSARAEATGGGGGQLTVLLGEMWRRLSMATPATLTRQLLQYCGRFLRNAPKGIIRRFVLQGGRTRGAHSRQAVGIYPGNLQHQHEHARVSLRPPIVTQHGHARHDTSHTRYSVAYHFSKRAKLKGQASRESRHMSSPRALRQDRSGSNGGRMRSPRRPTPSDSANSCGIGR